VVAGGLEVVLDDSWAATRARTEERATRESFILMRQKRQTLGMGEIDNWKGTRLEVRPNERRWRGSEKKRRKEKRRNKDNKTNEGEKAKQDQAQVKLAAGATREASVDRESEPWKASGTLL
jgi:hypothetical protein